MEQVERKQLTRHQGQAGLVQKRQTEDILILGQEEGVKNVSSIYLYLQYCSAAQLATLAQVLVSGGQVTVKLLPVSILMVITNIIVTVR